MQVGRTNPSLARQRHLPERTVFLEAEHSLPQVGPDFPEPPGDLDRPVLLTHGFNGKAIEWFGLKNFLSTNPHNEFGAVFQKGKEEEFRQAIRANPDAKIFAMNFDKPYRSYRDEVQEFTEAVKILNEETGGEIDVVAHSRGGLVARTHLDQGHDGIRKLVQIATPNHGALEADLALASDKLGVYKHYEDAAHQTLKDLSLDTTWLGMPNNPYLHALNERWPEQSAKVETTIIAGLGIPTPDYNWKLHSDGDGMVTARSAYLPGAAFAVADAPATEDRLFSFKYNHKSVMEHPRIVQYVGNVLSPPGAPPADSAPTSATPDSV